MSAYTVPLFIYQSNNCQMNLTDNIRPWHDTRVIAHAHAVTRANKEKGGLGGR